MEECCKDSVVNVMAYEANEVYKIMEILKQKNCLIEVKSETVETEEGETICGFYINVFNTETKEIIEPISPVLTYTINNAIIEWYNQNISDIDPEILEEIPPEMFSEEDTTKMQNESDEKGIPFTDVLYHTYLTVKSQTESE